MTERIERELLLEASPEQVWDAVTGDGWLADEVELDLRPGGDAGFHSASESREGWIEESVTHRRLTFWWASGGEPATRVELTLTPEAAATRLRVVETRPLEQVHLVGAPLPGRRVDGRGPALLAGAR